MLLYHASQSYQPQGPAGEALAFVLRLGWSGVDLFFVLSGFLITRILVRSRDAPHYFRNFYVRRLLRIVPVYYVVLLLLLVVVPQIPFFAQLNYLRIGRAEFEPLWYWLFLSNVYIALAGGFQHATLGVTWSLAIEEQFYLLWPLVVRWVDERRLVVVAAAVVVLSPALRTLALAQGLAPLSLFVLTPFRLDGLAFGALVALLARRPSGVARLAAAARVLLPVALLLFAACAVWGGWAGSPLRNVLFLHPLMQKAGFTLLLAVYACLLALCLEPGARGALARGFELSFLCVLGKYSYAMYLLHGNVNQVVNQFLPYWTMGSAQLGGLLAYCAASVGFTLLLARISWALVETPFLRLKSRFAYEAAGGGPG